MDLLAPLETQERRFLPNKFIKILLTTAWQFFILRALSIPSGTPTPTVAFAICPAEEQFRRQFAFFSM